MNQADSFKVGDRATVIGGLSNDEPMAVLTVAKVGARVTLSDGSMWYLPKGYATRYQLYGEHRKHSRYARIRATKPSDVESVNRKREEADAEVERRRLVHRVAGIAWSEASSLPTESLRQIVALLDAAKEHRG